MADDALHCLCPACGSDVPIHSGATILQCPACAHQFFLESPDEETVPAAPGIEQTEEHELDAVRIRQRITLVRSAYRSRSYAIIAAVVCGVLAIQAIVSAARRLSAKSYPPAMLYLLCAIAGAWGLIYFSRKAAGLDLEAKRSALSNPTIDPDFSSLSDGSHRVRNLEDIR